MSLRIDTAEWIAGALVIGNTGGGVIAESLAGAGDNGSGYLANDVTLPADAGKEICGRITYWPPGLSMFAYEDGGLVASAADGTYTAQYQLYVDYVATGPVTPITFVFGSAAVAGAIAWTEAPEAFAAAVTAQAPAVALVASWAEAAESFAITGTAFGLGVSVTAAWSEAPESFTAALTVTQAIAISAAWVEAAEACGLSISVTNAYARAPDGNGYSPRRIETQSRPPAIQRNNR